MKHFGAFLLAGLLIAGVALADGPNAVSTTVDETGSFLLVQNPNSGTTKKDGYYLATGGDALLSAWRFTPPSTWTKVWPAPADIAAGYCDSVAKCPEGFTIPIVGLYDALYITADSGVGTALGELQWYK